MSWVKKRERHEEYSVEINQWHRHLAKEGRVCRYFPRYNEWYVGVVARKELIVDLSLSFPLLQYSLTSIEFTDHIFGWASLLVRMIFAHISINCSNKYRSGLLTVSRKYPLSPLRGSQCLFHYGNADRDMRSMRFSFKYFSLKISWFSSSRVPDGFKDLSLLDKAFRESIISFLFT